MRASAFAETGSPSVSPWVTLTPMSARVPTPARRAVRWRASALVLELTPGRSGGATAAVETDRRRGRGGEGGRDGGERVQRCGRQAQRHTQGAGGRHGGLLVWGERPRRAGGSPSKLTPRPVPERFPRTARSRLTRRVPPRPASGASRATARPGGWSCGSSKREVGGRSGPGPSWTTSSASATTKRDRVRRISIRVMAVILRPSRSCHQWQNSRGALIYCHPGCMLGG